MYGTYLKVRENWPNHDNPRVRPFWKLKYLIGNNCQHSDHEATETKFRLIKIQILRRQRFLHHFIIKFERDRLLHGFAKH